MKSKKIKMLETVLRLMAKAVLEKYNPMIIGITGSVGKTSTKEAVFLVLAEKFRVRKNEKNYNNEIGLPLTVIGSESGNRSLNKWLVIFWKWITIMVFKIDYPEILVLEMGVDAPGDMKYLTSFIKPKITIVTNVSSSHLEFFRDLDHIAREKGVLVEKLPKDGIAILNADDERVLRMKERNEKISYINFSAGEKADVRSSGISLVYSPEDMPAGLSFKLNYDGKSIPVRLPHILAEHQVYAILAAAAVGIYLKINLFDIAKSAENYFSPPGRMNLLSGINSSMIIDDTYNASPASTIAALRVLEKIETSWKIIALGDMLELGSDEMSGHRRVLEKAIEINPREVFLVGRRMKKAFEDLDLAGKITCSVFFFENPVEAAEKIKSVIKSGDLVLVKGSQGMRMEKVTEIIVADPKQAKVHMCRQSKEWKEKPFSNP